MFTDEELNALPPEMREKIRKLQAGTADPATPPQAAPDPTLQAFGVNTDLLGNITQESIQTSLNQAIQAAAAASLQIGVLLGRSQATSLALARLGVGAAPAAAQATAPPPAAPVPPPAQPSAPAGAVEQPADATPASPPPQDQASTAPDEEKSAAPGGVAQQAEPAIAAASEELPEPTETSTATDLAGTTGAPIDASAEESPEEAKARVGRKPKKTPEPAMAMSAFVAKPAAAPARKPITPERLAEAMGSPRYLARLEAVLAAGNGATYDQILQSLGSMQDCRQVITTIVHLTPRPAGPTGQSAWVVRSPKSQMEDRYFIDPELIDEIAQALTVILGREVHVGPVRALSQGPLEARPTGDHARAVHRLSAPTEEKPRPGRRPGSKDTKPRRRRSPEEIAAERGEGPPPPVKAQPARKVKQVQPVAAATPVPPPRERPAPVTPPVVDADAVVARLREAPGRQAQLEGLTMADVGGLPSFMSGDDD